MKNTKFRREFEIECERIRFLDSLPISEDEKDAYSGTSLNKLKELFKDRRKSK